MRAARFFDAVYADNEARSLSERRRRLPDVLRYARGELLRPLDGLLARACSRRGQPVVFIVGAPRSGTTLLYQTLARQLAVAWIRNAVARHWSAPLVGALLDRLRHGLSRPPAELVSRWGGTSGSAGPHEFSWFWHYWGDFREHDDLRGPELDAVDWEAITLRLRGLAGFYGAPLVVKSINFTDYQVETLARRLPDARFLWISRDLLYCAQSILRVREERYGDRGRWWSVRPRDHESWAGRPAEEQVVHQVRDIEASLDRARSALGDERMLRLRYEGLVDRPAATLAEVARFLGVAIVDPTELQRLSLKSRNEVAIDPSSLRALERAAGGA